MSNTVPAAATGLSTCPVEPLAREANRLWRLYDRADADSSATKDPVVKRQFEQQTTFIWDRIKGVENYASHMMPQSGLGALFHVQLVSALVDNIIDNVLIPEDVRDSVRSDREKIERLLYALRAYLIETTGANPDDACGQSHQPEHLNPLITVD